jgi:hypothetical protein
MLKIGKTMLSSDAGKHHTLEKFKELFSNIGDLKGQDLEKLYYQLGGEKKAKRTKKEEAKE